MARATAEGAARRVLQCRDLARRFPAGVDQVFGQRADDAVPAGVDVADPALVLARGLNDAAGGGIDDGGDAAGLGVKGIHLLGHWHCTCRGPPGGRPRGKNGYVKG